MTATKIGSDATPARDPIIAAHRFVLGTVSGTVAIAWLAGFRHSSFPNELLALFLTLLAVIAVAVGVGMARVAQQGGASPRTARILGLVPTDLTLCAGVAAFVVGRSVLVYLIGLSSAIIGLARDRFTRPAEAG